MNVNSFYLKIRKLKVFEYAIFCQGLSYQIERRKFWSFDKYWLNVPRWHQLECILTQIPGNDIQVMLPSDIVPVK